MEDFEKRCAYSLVHVETISEHNMHVDHHDPTVKGKKLHAYGNLYPAASLCNNSKSGVWPTKKERARQHRFLDPCKEQDYGEHIFEDLQTCELVAVSRAGLYQIENCDLNNKWLTGKRLERRKDDKLRYQTMAIARWGSDPRTDILLQSVIASLTEKMKLHIPAIPPPPQGVAIIA
jgi:hypothetical protein